MSAARVVVASAHPAFSDPMTMSVRVRIARGFTLIEMLVVIGVIAVILGISFVAFDGVRERQRIDASRSLLDSVLSTMANQGSTTVTLDGTARLRWDADGNGILDGDPARDPGFATGQLRQDAKRIGYIGGLAIAVPDMHRDPADGRIIDAWRRPLHVYFAGKTYRSTVLRGDQLGATMIGLVSDGPDRRHGTDDDLPSWKRESP